LTAPRAVPGPAGTPTAEEIADRAQQLKVVMLAQQLTLVTLVDEGQTVLRFHQQITGTGPDGDIPVVLTGGTGHDQLVFSAREVLAAAAKLPGDAIRDLMTMSMTTAATTLGQMLKDGDHYQRDVPLLQFALHLRNAAAHGNRWHLRSGQPKHPAACRYLTITPDLHGRQAAWGTVSPQLFVLFLDDLANHFVPGSVPPPQRSAV
jgi:hypothetical protein